MTVSEIAALTAVILSVGTNVGLYIHLSSVMNNRFDSIERRFEMMQGDLHQIDIRMTRLEVDVALLKEKVL
jgi:hypothetical protein